jgi:hypothetical protein
MLEDPEERIVVMVLGRPCRKYIGSALQNLVGIFPLDEIELLREPIQMVEVLKKAEVDGHLDIGVRLRTSEIRREFDRDLLEGDRGLERALVSRIQPVDGVLLLMLDATQRREPALKLPVITHASEAMGEHRGFVLDAVHEDYATAREGVDLLFAKRRQDNPLPRSELLFDWRALFAERV